MSHIDNGALHAYLDGALDEFPAAEAEGIRAHLEACAECSERLESERRVRADAHSMLGMATPHIEVPSLEELRAYVKRTRPAPASARQRMARMGWAASVVLAVGAGWMLRGGQLQEAALNQRDGFNEYGASAPAEADRTAGAQERTSTSDFADEAGSVASTDRRVAEELESVSAPLARADLAGSGAAPARQGEVQAKTRTVSLDEVLEDRDVPATLVAAADAPTAPSAAPGAEPGAGQGAREVQLPTDAVGGVLRAEEARMRDASGVVDTAQGNRLQSATGAGAGLDGTATAAPPPAVPGNAAAEPAAEEGRRAERRLSESPVPVTSAMNQTGRGSVRLVPQPDARFSDEPSLGVPDFVVVSVTSLGEGTRPLGVRVVQRLEEGAMLEIYHLEPGVEVATVPPLPLDLNEVRVEAETGWVIMRGPRSEDELEVLLARLFPK